MPALRKEKEEGREDGKAREETARRHVPVLLKEAVDILNVEPGKIYVDGTLGGGGFSEEILKRLSGAAGRGGLLIGVDRDAEAVESVRLRLEKNAGGRNFKLFHSNFSRLDEILKEEGLSGVDGIVLDLGISSIQLEGGRGFGFNEAGPLDMRIDRDGGFAGTGINKNTGGFRQRPRLNMHMPEAAAGETAYDVVNGYPEEKIADIIWKLGDERFSRKIARNIVGYRKKQPIETPAELAEIVRNSVYRVYGKSKRLKADPATKTFMALRIFVNGEYGSLEEFLRKLKFILNKGGNVVIISFHSGEDRIVKNFFRDNSGFKPIHKKPLVPSDEEISANPRSRSAKLRAYSYV